MSERTLRERVDEVRGVKYITLKGGRRASYWDMLNAAERSETDMGRALSRALKLADDDWDLERVQWFIEGLESWLAAVRAEIEKRRGVLTKQDRIALLRNTTGRTPEEAQAFRAKADELEQHLSPSS